MIQQQQQQEKRNNSSNTSTNNNLKNNLNTVERLRECCDHLQLEIDKRQAKDKRTNKSDEPQSVIDLDEVGEVVDEANGDDDDVLILLPSTLAESDLHIKNKGSRLLRRNGSSSAVL